MPDTPDFDQIARRLAVHLVNIGAGGPGVETVWSQEIAEQLRLVWNARGAADIAMLDLTLTSQMGLDHEQGGVPYVKMLDRALCTLDR